MLRLVALFLTTSAVAGFHGGGGVVATGCTLYPAFSSIDGCGGAPPYFNSVVSFKNPTALSDGTIFQTGQTAYSRSQLAGVGTTPFSLPDNAFTWNIAGVDFAAGFDDIKYTNGVYCASLGQPCSTTQGAKGLIDATLYNWATDPIGTGCTGTGADKGYNGTTGELVCILPPTTTGQTPNIIGFDFTPRNADGSPKACSRLYIKQQTNSNGSSGTITIKDNLFLMQNMYQCLHTGHADANLDTGSVVQIMKYNQTTNTDVWNAVVSNNRFDGGANNEYVLNASQAFAIQNLGLINAGIRGSLISKYNYLTYSAGPVYYTQFTCGGFDVEDNVIHGISSFLRYSHAQINITNTDATVCATVPTQTLINNTAWLDAAGQNSNVTDIININTGGQGGPTTTWTNLDLRLNTAAVNQLWGYTLSSAAALAVTGSDTNYQVGNVITVLDGVCNVGTHLENGVSVANRPVRFVVNATTAGAVASIGAKSGNAIMFDGGSCGGVPANNTFFSTTCDFTTTGTYVPQTQCGNGLQIKYTGGTNFKRDAIGNVIVMAGVPATAEVIATSSLFQHNALYFQGTVANYLRIDGYNGSYGFFCTNPMNTLGLTASNPNFDANSGGATPPGSVTGSSNCL